MSPLEQAAHQNFLLALRQVEAAGHSVTVADDGPWTMFDCGPAFASFRRALLRERAGRPAAAVSLAQDWFAKRGVGRFRFVLREQAEVAVVGAAKRAGFLPEGSEPVMRLSLGAAPPLAPLSEATVRRVHEPDVDLYAAVEPGGPDDLQLRLAIAREALRSDGCALFVGEVEGKAAGRAMAVATPPVLGIYNVHTALSARRRGVASALTLAAVTFGHDTGCTHAYLAATPAGQVVYTALGFEEVDAYVALEGPSLRS